LMAVPYCGSLSGRRSSHSLSIESEYVVAMHGSKEVLWLWSLISEVLGHLRTWTPSSLTTRQPSHSHVTIYTMCRPSSLMCNTTGSTELLSRVPLRLYIAPLTTWLPTLLQKPWMVCPLLYWEYMVLTNSICSTVPPFFLSKLCYSYPLLPPYLLYSPHSFNDLGVIGFHTLWPFRACKQDP
jgi:hypothetical protein